MEENIADALKMAGSVLLFVMGLSIAILAFSQARESMDIVLSYSDRESLSIEGNPRFYYLSKDNDTSRYVGKETIIPAIYRAYKENYSKASEISAEVWGRILCEKRGSCFGTSRWDGRNGEESCIGRTDERCHWVQGNGLL